MEWLQNWIDGLNIVWVIILFVLGLAMIVKGGDFFVDAASWMADVSGIPKLIIGATVVSLATTLPELLVSVFAAAAGSVDLAAGNAIGSVIANIGIIMSLSILFMPSLINRKDYMLKAVLMLLPALIMFIFCFNGLQTSSLTLWASLILLVIFIVNITENVLSAKKHIYNEKLVAKQNSSAEITVRIKPTGKAILINVVKFIVGAVGIVVGAELMVSTATRIAHELSISEQVIGLTIVAIGTSLPELVTTITAIAKKQSSLSVGNIIGANIIDLTLILPLCAVITGGSLPISAQTVCLDIPVCLLVGVLALVPALVKGKFSRWQGVALLCVYVCYVVFMAAVAPSLGWFN